VKKLADVIELAKFASRSVVPAAYRVSRCQVCDEDVPGTDYVCGNCLATHNTAIKNDAFRRLNKSVPQAYRDCRFGSERVAFTNPDHADAVARSNSRGLIITGAAGFGKTTLAVAKLYQLFDAGRQSCFFVSATDLARAARSHPLGDGDAPTVNRARSTGVLVLDDVGKEKQDLSGVVSDVIFYRHSHGKRTIATAGFGVEAAVAAYDDGIARRLFEEDWVILGGKKQ